jgi:hypothetical protein
VNERTGLQQRRQYHDERTTYTLTNTMKHSLADQQGAQKEKKEKTK